MPRIEFEPIAAAGYDQITDPATLEKVDDVLDAWEDNPGQAWLRVHRWADPPLWGVSIRAARDEWLILWHFADDPEVIIVDYIGPDVRR